MSVYRIIHKTKYASQEPVSVGHNEARLQPRTLPYQSLRSHRLECRPAASIVDNRLDWFGNTVTTFSFNQGYSSLEVIATSEVSVLPRQVHSATRGGDSSLPVTCGQVRRGLLDRMSPQDLLACEFLFDSPKVQVTAELAEYGATLLAEDAPLLIALKQLTSKIHSEFKYQAGTTNVQTPLSQVFVNKRGVCQDFAQIQIGVLRANGLAARYVSGYLRTIPPPGKPRLVGADASHAWVSVYCGPLGWLDYDPTNDLLVDTQHVTLAFGRDYSDVPPLSGVFIGGAQCQLSVSVDVCPLEEAATSRVENGAASSLAQ